MYDHMYQRGYVENIPGSPMCGCVEHMPVVTRADCTQTNLEEHYTFKKNTNAPGFSSTIDNVKLQYQACQGANNKNNDLEAFVEQLVNDGKLSTTEQDIFKTRVVGDNNCPIAIENLYDAKGFEIGHNIDDTKWRFVSGEEFDDWYPIMNHLLVKEMVEALEVPIVRRVCPSCVDSHKDIYYRRLTTMPASFNLLDTLKNNWVDTDNLLNVDFSLHSTYLDAFLGINGWTFCNYNDSNIGFPRDCGPDGRVNNQWNSYTRGGGNAYFHAFLLPADSDFETELEFPTFPMFLGTDYASQQGTKSSGSAITNFDNNDYLTYASANFGPSGTTKGLLFNYAKGNGGGRVEIRLGAGTSGRLIAELHPAQTAGWSSYITAYVDIEDDVEGLQDITIVAKDQGGVLNLAWFELSDFSDRDELHLRVLATEYSDQSGGRFETVHSSLGNLGYFDNNDYVTYTHLNFGPAGTTDGIRISYAKASGDAGNIEIRDGGIDGTLIAEFKPINTGGWANRIEAYVGLDGLSGVHDLTFVAKDQNGVFNMESFQLSYRSDLFPRVLATELFTHSGVKTDLFAIKNFDNGDFVTYSNLNFGPSGTTKSMSLEYSKRNSNNGKLELRLDGPEGPLIADFIPRNTGGWGDYVTIDIPLNLVDGIHDLTFVATEAGSVMNWKSFELSDKLFFKLDTDYKVNDENGNDVQCTYSVVKDAYMEQVFNRYFSTTFSSAEEKFYDDLGVNDEAGAEQAVYDLCASAQAAMEQIPLDDIAYDEGSQFIELYYAGRASWNEETQTNLFPGNSTTPVNVLKDDAYKVDEYKSISEISVFKLR
mmetsp:Transcript_614/g.699  ORF Transcript_614/g.699 Transcript_614/m.699 type:complete len:819 (-) Transcript_614:14-2470(-)